MILGFELVCEWLKEEDYTLDNIDQFGYHVGRVVFDIKSMMIWCSACDDRSSYLFDFMNQNRRLKDINGQPIQPKVTGFEDPKFFDELKDYLEIHKNHIPKLKGAPICAMAENATSVTN